VQVLLQPKAEEENVAEVVHPLQSKSAPQVEGEDPPVSVFDAALVILHVFSRP
jgi:hypothetical protein